MTNKRTTVITGATSGIGEATARLLAKGPYRLVLCGRREDRLAKLKEELSDLSEVHTLCFDVRDRGAVEKSLKTLPQEWQEIDVLINNAGNAHGLDPFHEGSIEDWEAMLDINVKGLLYMSRAISPGMVERKSGHIINIGSIAGKEVYPRGNVYCGSKFAVDAISSGMRIDLVPYNVKVSLVNPGLVNTEFSKVRFKGDQEKADATYSGMQPLVGDDIANIIGFILGLPAHVNISDLTTFPASQASAAIVHRESN